ncbi:MAG: hypothetical protein ACRD8O_21070 [Bryobacteraceae bacterium]
MFTRIGTLLGLAALIAIVPALAEMPLKFDVPFDFSVGQTKMEAGTYLVQYPNSSCVLVKREDTKQAVFIITQGTERTKTRPPTLLFNRYGNHYFLSEIWSPGLNGRQIRKSKTELEIVRRATDGGELVAVSR